MDTEAIDEPMTEDNYGNFTRSQGGYAEPRVDASDAWDSMFRAMADPAPYKPSSKKPTSPFTPNIQKVDQMYHFAARHVAKEAGEDLTDKMGTYSALAEKWKGDDVDEIGMGTAVLIDKLGTEYAGSPESYFLAQGKPMPPFKTKTDIYRAVWRDFEQESIKIYKKNKETERVMLDAMDKVEKASLSYVQGTSFEHLPELLRYSQNPEEGIKSFTKARQAYALVNKIGFRDLDEFTRENSNSLHKIIGEDQYAFTLFADALRNKVESEGLDSIEFFTNIKRGLNKKSEEIGAFLDNRARLGKDAIDIGGGVVVPADSDGSPSDMWDEVVNVGRDLVGMERAPAKGKPMEESWEYQNKNSIDKLVGLISENEEIASKTKKDAAWYTKALNGAGRMLGDSSPFMMPNNSGLAMALMGELERASNSAALHGGTGFDIFVDASRNIVEEKALGAFSVFGKFGITGKLLKKLNKSSLVNLAAKAPLRSFVSGTKTGKFASTVLFQTAEELIGEPIAGNTYEALTSKAIALAGGELRAREFTPLKGIWESLNDPEEGAACIVFCGIMTGTAWRQATAEVADYVSSVERARLTGFTKAHARELANIKDDDVRTSKAKEYFDKDVLGDPAGASKRAQEAGRELISSQEAAWHNASGLAEKALKSVGVDKVEKLPDSGNYRVTMQAGSEGEASIYEMTSDQTAEMTRLALDDTRVNAIRDMQSRLMGDAIAESASKNIDYINVMDMFSDSAPAEYRASAEQLGGMSLKGMQDLSRRATERINSIMTSEGLTRAEAEKSVAPEILNGVALGSLETLPNKFTQRIDMAEESREITAQDARRLKEGNVRATNAHRFGIASDPTSSLIMVANGEASAREVLEDVVESAVVNIVGSGTSNWWNLWQQLSSLDKELSKYGVSIGADGGKADSMKVIEAFSNLALVDVIANADNMELTEDARNLIEFSLKNLEDTSYLMGLVDGYNEFISTDEGKRFLGENKNLVDLLDEAGATTQSIFKTARFNAEINQARLSLYQERAAQRQIRGDSRLTPEEQEESLAAAEQEDEEKITDEEKEGSGEGEVALNYSEVDVLTLDREGNVLDIAGESEVDPVAGAGFAENRFVRISNDCIMGLVNVDKLALAPDVEQFKEGATGGGIIKGKELQGKFDKNADPISVWRRKDGSLHVITGRHRFDLARREGVKVMPARIYTEDATHDVTWAKLHDIEKNIRDNQASAMEVAYYVRNNNRTKEWLQAEGLLRGGSIAEMGYDIASLACEDVFDRLKNGDITARQAYNICHASNTEKGQMVACRLIKEGKSLEYVNSYVREADRIVSRTEGDYDLFGNDDSWVKECAQVAEYVTKSVALINERLGILKKSNGLMRKKGEAEKMGIRLETPEDIKSHIIALERLKQEYQHHDTRLNIHGASMAWDGKSELNPFTHVRKDEGGDSGSFSLISPESIHAHWKESLEEYLSGKNPKKDRDITVCPTPAVLRMLGAKAHDLVITPGVIDKVMHDKHAVSREAMEGLSLAIENPIAVFESATSANSLVLLTELKEGENNIVVAVQLNDKSGRISVNRVKSVYGKEDARALLYSSCFYWDIKKARLWLTASGLQLSAAVPSTKGRRRTMLKPADIVKWKDKNNVSFSVVSMDNTGKTLSAETFITKKDGNPDWFVIPKRAGQKEMPVRLLVGEDKAYHKGYGLNHLVASRVEDDLWEKTSPAKYISDILENASELYEVSPGRELLVKGKQPSSWMVLQLDRQEEYYSIITAYPARLGQKPLGRKIPLAERSVAQRQLPTNTESGTVRLEGGSVANATLQPSFAGEKSATQLPAGSDSVNIKDVICQLNDGGTLPASFSLTTSESLWTRMYEAEFDAKLSALHKKGAKSIEDWRKVCAAQDTPVAKIAEVYGEVMATVSTMYKVLPVGFRFAVEPYMKKATNAATELEGKEFLSPEMKGMRAKNVTQRMGEVMDSLLVRSEVQLEKYMKARIKRDMDKALKSLKIKKAPNGKSKKGKLSADNYRKLEEYTSMLNAKEEDKEEQVSILEGILQNTQSTEEQRDKAEESFADWAVFGCWKSMGIAEAKNAYASLMEFITAGRTLWAEKQERNRLTNKRKAELVVEAVGTGNANDYRKVKEDAKASLPSKAKSFVTYGFKSFSQMLLSLSGDANLKEWMNNEISDIAKANVLLRNMSNERMANVDGLIKRVAGLKKDKEARQWLTKFKKTRDTGIALNPTGEKTVKVTIEEARRLVAMTYAEREGERKKITADYHKRGMSAREAIVPEQAIALLKTRLGEIDGTILAPQKPRGGIKYITVKAVIESPYKTVSLKVSPAQAMYTILLSEQAGYSENLASAGIGESELQALREFVGADGLAFGYGLRQLMNKQGDLLAHVYEEREGVPFPRVENYYRAVFKIDHKNVEGRGFGEAGATGAIGGGAKYGMLIQRRKHSLDLAWDTDCVAVFKAATAEVDNYIATSGITSRWRSILSDRYAAPSLMRHLGKHGYDSLRQWLNIIDGAGVVEGGAMLAQAQLVSHFQGARAIALLSHNFITLAKQLSGLLHGNISGEVKISSHVKGLAKVMVGTGKISLSEMMATDAFNARQSNHKELESIMTYASDQNYNEVMRFAMAGMNAIERMDIFSNAVSMAALYDAKCNELNDINKEAEDKMTEEEMHAMCMVSVTRAMELSAQPLSATQKSLMGNSQNAGAKILCFMGGETLNKFGLMLSHISAGKYLTAIALYAEMSLAEQSIIALYNALLSDDEEWAKKGGGLLC